MFFIYSLLLSAILYKYVYHGLSANGLGGNLIVH